LLVLLLGTGHQIKAQNYDIAGSDHARSCQIKRFGKEIKFACIEKSMMN